MRRLRKPQLPLLLTLVAAGLIALPFVAFPQDSHSAAQLEQQVAADRAQAAKLRADAAQWQEMASKAETRAANATNQTLKEVWEQSASQERAQANQFTQQAQQLEQRADAEAAAAANQRAQAQPTAPPQQQASPQPQPAATASRAANPSPQTASAPSPAPAPMTTSAASGEPSQTQASSPSQSAGENPIELSEILGNWLNTADHSIVQIEEMYPGENKTAIHLKGKHDEWGGTFTRGSGDKPSHVSFMMGPKFDQMNPQAPQWARQQVAGKLQWFLELDTQGCGPMLSGKWYRGEIKWTDSDQLGAAKEASAVSHVRDVPVELEKTSEKPDYEGHPSIRVRSALRKLPFTTADSLYHDEPFYVDVILPENEAKNVGMDLTVTLHSAMGNDTSTLGLSSFSPDVHRFAVYTTLDPVTMAHGGNGAHHGMLAHLASQAFKAMMPGNMSRLRFVNGDTITVSYKDSFGAAQTTFTAYAQPVLQDEARIEASLRQLEVGFNAGLANADAEGARGLGMKLRMIKNALRIMDDELTIRDSVHNPYEAYSVGAAYLTMLTDSAAWKSPAPGSRPIGPWDPLLPSGQLVPDHRFPAVAYYSNFERIRVDQALTKGQSRALKVVERGLDSAGLATVQFFIASTGADQFAIIAFGVDMNGQPVDAMTRFTTGLSFGGSLILRGASLAQMVQGEMVEGERRAARSAGPKAAEAASAEEKVVGDVSAGASGASRLAATGIPAQVIIGAETDLETHVPSTKTAFTLPGAKAITDRNGKAIGFLLQQFDDTCGVVVSETMARDGGAQHLTEGQGMIKAYREGKAYQAGRGMNVVNVRDYLKSRGAQTSGYRYGVTLSAIEAELAQGGQVAVMINTAPAGEKPNGHWVRVLKIERGNNGVATSVIYGDPWTGTHCEAEACVFRSSMRVPDLPPNQKPRQFGVVFAKW
jgi:hypothetical protein